MKTPATCLFFLLIGSIACGDSFFSIRSGLSKIKHLSGRDIYSDGLDSSFSFTYLQEDKFALGIEFDSFTIPGYYEYWNGTCFDFGLTVQRYFFDLGFLFKSDKGFFAVSSGCDIGPGTAEKNNIVFDFGNSWRILFTKGFRSTKIFGEDIFFCLDAGAEFSSYTRYFMRVGMGITDMFHEIGQ